MRMSGNSILFFGLILFPVGVWGVLYTNMHYLGNGMPATVTDSTQQLPYLNSPKAMQTMSAIETQAPFTEGDTLMSSGDTAGARAAYTQLSGTVTDVQHGALLYRLALTDPDPVNAVQILEALAVDASNTDDLQSHAVEGIGWLYEHASSSAERTAIADSAFSSAPFDRMLENNNVDLAMARLFSYASAIRPSPYADVMAGMYYGQHVDLSNVAASSSLTSDAIQVIDDVSHVAEQLPTLQHPILPGYASEVQTKFTALKQKLGPFDPTL